VTSQTQEEEEKVQFSVICAALSSLTALWPSAGTSLGVAQLGICESVIMDVFFRKYHILLLEVFSNKKHLVCAA